MADVRAFASAFVVCADAGDFAQFRCALGNPDDVFSRPTSAMQEGCGSGRSKGGDK